MKVTAREVFSIPNILSYIRILFIPIFLYLYLNATESKDYYVVGLIIILSALTDLFDGLIARKFNQITELGKIVDPVADKLTQIAIVIALMLRYQFMWVLVILFIVKELFMVINGLILLRKGKKLDGAKWFGKVSTAVFYIAMGVLITFSDLHPNIAAVLMIVTGIFLALSFVLYIPEYAKMYRTAR
ncbi:CDP-alcohol phosphatidyltransferase family protein [Oceanobacillus chungangensis]|uniref:CDP-diacylglycerol--glycerol-3-phosphate 3-phosphatidyltransferase n=1 Tax=Oceanobacillus chungangensis TaxID=1229152 RepID=A0A3D8PQ99_9BACI|nr:CDP-alcohol phosphatidyltransferase family protein [Oceanobacillus chungangensis]RDW17418.1 CDP-diacylglycerol--glycerol-3-phosphate 3-phosphatidyltransferase [Oceanobacillus chungangensis]